MFWIFAALILLSILAITVSHSGPIRVGGCVILVVLLAIGLFRRLGDTENEARAPPRDVSVSPAALVAAIDLQTLSLSQWVLKGAGGPFELRGRINNGARGMHLSSVTLGLVRRDCHPAALDPQGCDTVWQDRHWVAVDIPAGEARDFATVIWAHSPIARARGTVRDEITIVAASGEPTRTDTTAPER